MLKKHNTKSIFLFLKHLKSFNKKPVFIFKKQSYSYNNLVTDSITVAKWIKKNKYNRLMFTLNNSPLSLCLYLGCWLSETNVYPINPRLISNEIINIIKTVHPDALLIEHNQTNEKFVWNSKECNIDIHVVKTYDKFLREINNTKNEKEIKSSSSTSITYHFSSGTNDGKYKKHGHNTKQILNYAYLRQFDLGIIAKDILLIALSINHAFSFSYQILPGLALGTTMILLPKYNANLIRKDIIKYNVTSIALLPTMYHFLLSNIEKEKHYSHNIRFLMVAGDQPSSTLLKRTQQILGVPLFNGIGMTETYGYGQNTICNRNNNTISIFKDTKIMIKAFNIKNLKNKDIVGEIFLKNHMLPVTCNKSWLETGDIGLVNKSKLKFLGRIKNIITKGGSKISPIEIENYLNMLPSIEESIIIGKNDEVWGELICACIIMKKGKTVVGVSEINGHLKKYLARYKHVDKVYYFNSFPKNTNSKINRNKLSTIIHEKSS